MRTLFAILMLSSLAYSQPVQESPYPEWDMERLMARTSLYHVAYRMRYQLELSEEQMESLEDLVAKNREEFQRIRATGVSGPESRAILRDMTTDSMKTIENHILLPHQVDQIKQHTLSARFKGGGLAAVIASDDVLDFSELGIRDDQIEQILDLDPRARQDLQRKREELSKEFREKMDKINAEYVETLLGPLTEKQKEKLKGVITPPDL